MIKVVIDTSVFIAAFLSKSQTSASVQVFNRWREQQFTLVMAPQLMRELNITTVRKFLPHPYLFG